MISTNLEIVVQQYSKAGTRVPEKIFLAIPMPERDAFLNGLYVASTPKEVYALYLNNRTGHGTELRRRALNDLLRSTDDELYFYLDNLNPGRDKITHNRALEKSLDAALDSDPQRVYNYSAEIVQRSEWHEEGNHELCAHPYCYDRGTTHHLYGYRSEETMKKAAAAIVEKLAEGEIGTFCDSLYFLDEKKDLLFNFAVSKLAETLLKHDDAKAAYAVLTEKPRQRLGQRQSIPDDSKSDYYNGTVVHYNFYSLTGNTNWKLLEKVQKAVAKEDPEYAIKLSAPEQGTYRRVKDGSLLRFGLSELLRSEKLMGADLSSLLEFNSFMKKNDITFAVDKLLTVGEYDLALKVASFYPSPSLQVQVIDTSVKRHEVDTEKLKNYYSRLDGLRAKGISKVRTSIEDKLVEQSITDPKRCEQTIGYARSIGRKALLRRIEEAIPQSAMSQEDKLHLMSLIGEKEFIRFTTRIVSTL